LILGLGKDIGVPVVVVQHISTGFAGGMASWLSSTCPLPVKLASQGDEPVAGTVYLAPDDRHLLVNRQRKLIVSSAPPANGFRPSANVLFESLAESYGREAVGVLLTGMGDDGADGIGTLRASGAMTFAQDAQTSVVHGMPAAAIARGAIDQVLPLQAVAPAIRSLLGLGARPA
jgi:two-component system chemotaxis response regulator CheB